VRRQFIGILFGIVLGIAVSFLAWPSHPASAATPKCGVTCLGCYKCQSDPYASVECIFQNGCCQNGQPCSFPCCQPL